MKKLISRLIQFGQLFHLIHIYQRLQQKIQTKIYKQLPMLGLIDILAQRLFLVEINGFMIFFVMSHPCKQVFFKYCSDYYQIFTPLIKVNRGYEPQIFQYIRSEKITQQLL
ncbi:unnamed protein product [Paramecium pentaurelia]|uniref:Uncharacterized protein n=1 Tax=Paramecium pentaurelia TaxID=43138 RepID=A0A8S1UKR9_9CILI|nr:unnamed protein product [Paramecium pentaurelia]